MQVKISFDLGPEGGACISFWLEVNELKEFMKTDMYKELIERYEISRTGLYADNSLYAANVLIAVKGNQWSEFENGRLFHSLKSYLEAVHHERRGK